MRNVQVSDLEGQSRTRDHRIGDKECLRIHFNDDREVLSLTVKVIVFGSHRQLEEVGVCICETHDREDPRGVGLATYKLIITILWVAAELSAFFWSGLHKGRWSHCGVNRQLSGSRSFWDNNATR